MIEIDKKGENVEPLLSIVIANYNYGHFLEDAIRSVIDQDDADCVELIICDAKSTDNSVDIIRKYENKIAWWCSEPDHGQSEAFNKGFSHAHGRFLTWLNADDLLLPGSVSRLKAESEKHPDCEWFVGGSIWCNRHFFVQKLFRPHRFSMRRLRERQLMVGGPSSFFTRELYERAGRIDENLHYVMDCDLWYKFALNCGCRYRSLGVYTWAFRFHEDSKTNGRVARPDAPIARVNADKFASESRAYKQKYGVPTGIFKYTRRIPVSFLDALRVKAEEWRYSGRHINEMFPKPAAPIDILLSNPIQEYVTGLLTVVKSVHAFRTDFYRKQVNATDRVHILAPEDFSSLSARVDYVVAAGISVLYAQGARTLIDMVRLRRACPRHQRPRVIVTCHSPALWANFPRAAAFVLYAALFADGMVFLVERYRRKWRWLYALFGLRTWHVPNPVDVTRFHPVEHKIFEGRPIVVGCIGSINRRKRQDVLIQMAALLRKKGLEIKVRLAGNCTDEPFKDRMESMITDLKLEECVTFDGRIPYDEVPAWFGQIDVYMCPSDDEVMPFSILEAMSMRLPVVAHDVAGIHEEVRDGLNGYLIRSSDPNDYAMALERVIAPRQYSRMGDEGRRLASQEFAMSKFGTRMGVVCSGS